MKDGRGTHAKRGGGQHTGRERGEGRGKGERDGERRIAGWKKLAQLYFDERHFVLSESLPSSDGTEKHGQRARCNYRARRESSLARRTGSSLYWPRGVSRLEKGISRMPVRSAALLSLTCTSLKDSDTYTDVCALQKRVKHLLQRNVSSFLSPPRPPSGETIDRIPATVGLARAKFTRSRITKPRACISDARINAARIKVNYARHSSEDLSMINNFGAAECIYARTLHRRLRKRGRR